MDALYLIGRILFSLVFLLSAVGHFTKTDAMAAYAGSRGLPAPRLSVLVTGAVLLAGALSVLLGVWLEVGIWLLVLFLLASAATMHAFWKMEEPMQRAVEQAMFLKNVSLAGGGIILYWTIQVHGYGPFVLGAPLG